MKIVEGFTAARALLSRQAPAEPPGSDEREQVVRQISREVRDRGDAALLDYTEKFDGVRPAELEVPRERVSRAYREGGKELLEALKMAAERTAAFHQAQKDSLLRESTGSSLGWLIRPLDSVGVHVPGFTAPLPSSLLMTAVPARV